MREFLRMVYGASDVRVRQHAYRRAAIAATGLMISGCALPVAIPGLGDEGPTGTIKPAVVSPFSSEMDVEDWRRAKSALDTALDPQGNGAKVAWDNPQSGAKGAFVPLAQPFPQDDGICRAFSARVEVQGRAARSVKSSACRRNGGEWIVGRIVPVADEKAALRKPEAKLAERDTATHLN